MFADRTNPVRCSKLASICKCSARIYMLGLDHNDDDELGGPAAQTGSLTHKGAEAFHKTQDKPLDYRKGAAWDAIQQHASTFPAADIDEVRLFITPYMDDPRNINANCVKVEWSMENETAFFLPPHELDPYQAPIWVRGTIDQIRLVNGIPYIYDIKTGKKTVWEMLHDYAIQIAAYTYGARQNGFPNCEPGYLIRTMGYRSKAAAMEMPTPNGVFLAAPFTGDKLDTILEGVRFHVAMIRIGHIQVSPGPHCTFCEHGGLTNCVPKLETLIQLNSKLSHPAG